MSRRTPTLHFPKDRGSGGRSAGARWKRTARERCLFLPAQGSRPADGPDRRDHWRRGGCVVAVGEIEVAMKIRQGGPLFLRVHAGDVTGDCSTSCFALSPAGSFVQ